MIQTVDGDGGGLEGDVHFGGGAPEEPVHWPVIPARVGTVVVEVAEPAQAGKKVANGAANGNGRHVSDSEEEEEEE